MTIVGYLCFRCLSYPVNEKFYIRKSTHPHPVVRMTNVQIRVTEGVIQNTELKVNGKRIIHTAMSIMEYLSNSIEELKPIRNFVSVGQKNMESIRDYVKELQDKVLTLPVTAFLKSQNHKK
jgi:hypothetical protein